MSISSALAILSRRSPAPAPRAVLPSDDWFGAESAAVARSVACGALPECGLALSAAGCVVRWMMLECGPRCSVSVVFDPPVRGPSLARRVASVPAPVH